MLPIIGIALAASVALARDRLPRWLDLVIALVSALVPLGLFDRAQAGEATGRTLWEWSAAGGPVVQAAYQVDDLALIGAATVTIVTAAALHAVARAPSARPLLVALVAIDGIALVALVAVIDVVAGALVAGAAATVTVAIALFVASASAAARLAALLALGVEAFIAAALLLSRFGIATFDLDRVPSGAINAAVLAATTLGAALFCGLYPFVPWRYEPRGVIGPLASLRGVALYPIGVAGSVLALRIVTGANAPTTELALPDIPVAAQAALLVVIVALTALAARAGPREARARRALTGAAFLALALAFPALRWSHVVALLALLTVLYAAVASAAIVEDWQVARFDVRLGTLWAAIASGAPLALAGALFGLLASAIAQALELLPVPAAARVGVDTSARMLVVLGPFLALGGLATTPDPIVGALCALALATAGALELGHAVREAPRAMVRGRERAYATLAAFAMIALVGLLVAAPVGRAATSAFAVTTASWSDLVFVGLTPIVVALIVVVVALPRVVEVGLAPRVLAVVRRVLTATDPVPALALTYRGLEVWSRRVGASFASLEDRAGVWVATVLLALTLLWAASS